jgi:DNA-directed RNA polymerase specialized sigma24 family protein
VQDSWVAVLRGIDAFQGRCQFGTWLMRAEPVEAGALNPEAVVLATETRTLLEQAIRALPERQRAVLVLRDVDGWPADEVCTALKVSTGNQRLLLHRARAAIRSTLHSSDPTWADPIWRRHDLVPA